MDKKEFECFKCVSTSNCGKLRNDAIRKNPYCNCAGGSVICVGSTGPSGQTGPQGAEGISPFEIAVENGFIGTYDEWINSLQGPTGSAPSMGSIVPFSSTSTESFYELDQGSLMQSLFFLGFMGFNLDMQIEDGNIQTISLDEEDSFIPTFVAVKNSTITGISFEGCFEFDFQPGGIDFVVKVVVYTSPAGSNVFTLVPNTLFNLTPAVSISEITNVYGTLQLEHPVASGTKVALAAFIEPLNTVTEPIVRGNMFGNSWAGLNIREEE